MAHTTPALTWLLIPQLPISILKVPESPHESFHEFMQSQKSMPDVASVPQPKILIAWPPRDAPVWW
jgi:hypothetical protein